jgi:predicted PurR-regulated permease PerM
MVDVHLLLAHYMRALVLLCLATFLAYSIAFSLMGLPFGVLLAVVAMCLEIIPTLGPLAAALIIILVSAISGSHVLAVIIFLVLYRMFQDYVLSPHLMGQGVQLHGLLVLFGVFAGAQVAGIAGSFLSVPLLALARIFYLHMRRSRVSVPSETVRLAG